MTCEPCRVDPGVWPLRVDGADVDVYGCAEHARRVVYAYLLGRRMETELDAVRGRLAIWAASDRIASTGQLAELVGGPDPEFAGRILELLSTSDAGNRIRLRQAFPDLFVAYVAWQACRAAPTPGELWAAIQRYANREVAEAAGAHAEEVIFVWPAADAGEAPPLPRDGSLG